MYRGVAWARLLDDFVQQVVVDGVDAIVWARNPFTRLLAHDIMQEMAAPDRPAATAPPSTLLGALHRGAKATDDDDGALWFDLHHILAWEGDLWRALAGMVDHQGHHGLGAALAAARDTGAGLARAWPVGLRSAAVRHVHDRLRQGACLPRTPRVLVEAGRLEPTAPRSTVVGALADWLCELRRDPHPHAATDPDMHHHVVRRVADVLLWSTHPTPVAWDQDALEHDEAVLVASATARHGPVTEAAEQHLARHLDHLGRLILEAARHGRDHWTEAQRDAYGHRPDAAQQAVLQDQMLCAGDDYLMDCARRLTRLVRDPLVEPDAIEALTGDSHLRPATLYPTP